MHNSHYPWPARNWVDEQMKKAVVEVLDYYSAEASDMPSQGVFEETYCQAFVDYMGGAGFCDAVNSGTCALYIALKTLRKKEKGIVLMSPVTDFGSVSSVIEAGFRIKLMDSKVGSYNPDFETFMKSFGSDVDGVILTHVGGESIGDIEKISNFLKEKGVWLIEDCSQAHGSVVGGRKVGSFGDMAVFSTMNSKNHTTGGAGGLVFTMSRQLHERARSVADRGKHFFAEGFSGKDPSFIQFPSLNYNSSEIACAIGKESLSRLDGLREKRIAFLSALKDRLCAFEDFSLSGKIEGSSPYYWPLDIFSTDSTMMKKKLVELGLPCNPHYDFLVHEWEWADESVLTKADELPNVIAKRNGSVNLLFNEKFTDDELGEIVRILELAKGADLGY